MRGQWKEGRKALDDPLNTVLQGLSRADGLGWMVADWGKEKEIVKGLCSVDLGCCFNSSIKVFGFPWVELFSWVVSSIFMKLEMYVLGSVFGFWGKEGRGFSWIVLDGHGGAFSANTRFSVYIAILGLGVTGH